MKFLLPLLLVFNLLHAVSYHFDETRYSDALDKSITMSGIISFDKGLNIVYTKSTKSIHYEDEELTCMDDGEIIDLPQNQAIQLSNYFDIVLMLFHNETTRIQKEFTLKKKAQETILFPKNTLKKYIQKISLKK